MALDRYVPPRRDSRHGVGVLDPLFAPADEASHTIRAAAVSRGQLTGDPLAPEQAADLTWGDRRAAGSTTECIPRRRRARNLRHTRIQLLRVSTGSHARLRPLRRLNGDQEHRHSRSQISTCVLRGWGCSSRPFKPGSAQMYAMRIASVLLMAGLLASAFETVFTFARSRVAAFGLLAAVTPQVLFINAAVNPSSMEIAAGIALWTSGVTLARATPEEISNRLIARTGLAAILLVLARHASPLWLGLILVALVLFTNRVTLEALVRRRAAWFWGTGLAIAATSTVAWIESRTHSRRSTASSRRGLHEPAGAPPCVRGHLGSLQGDDRAVRLVRHAGAISHDLLVDWASWDPGRRRPCILPRAAPAPRFCGYLRGSALVPVAVDSYSAISNDVGMTWQGRYGLPFAVGVPIVAGLLASTTESQIFFRRRVLVALWAAAVVAQTAAFWQMLRKYTSGADGALRFWVHPKWSPPIPVLTVAIAFPLAMAAFAWWCLSTAIWTEQSGFSEAASQRPRLAHSAP